MAVASEQPKGTYQWHNEVVYVTEAARRELDNDNLWHHLGGYSDEGDSYETQQYYIEQELDEFWSDLIGPHEQLRHDLVKRVNQHYSISGKWQKVIVEENGTISIHFKDGKIETIKQPAED